MTKTIIVLKTFKELQAARDDDGCLACPHYKDRHAGSWDACDEAPDCAGGFYREVESAVPEDLLVFPPIVFPEPAAPQDIQVGGDHYKDFAIQPTDFIHANAIPFIEGNVIKYVCRHKRKNGRQDLLKAKHYIELLLALEYPQN